MSQQKIFSGEMIMNSDFCLCDFDYSLNKVSSKICEKCTLIFTLIDSIDDATAVTCFRALSPIERKTLANVDQFYRGRREIEPIELYDRSLSSTVTALFKTVRETLNNKTSGDANKQFSYSKCLVVPLIKYISKENSDPVMAISKLDLNSVVLEYGLTYFPWNKARFGDSIYQTASETSIGIKELFNVKKLSLHGNDLEFLKTVYNNIGAIPFEYYLTELIQELKECSNNQVEFSDLHKVDSLRIISVTLDLTPLNRSLLDSYYQEHDRVPKIKRLASFNKDHEVYSTESPFLSSRFLKGKELIDDIKVIAVFTILLAQKEVDSRFESIITEFIKCTKDKVCEYDKVNIDFIVSHLKDNSSIEFETLLGYLKMRRSPLERDSEWIYRILDVILDSSSVGRRSIQVLMTDQLKGTEENYE